ncbi:hypothetical protein BaRGS_00019647 [Batillaria attramentaria]|uniref:Uncharacterized protein n=1 Tax=Batillaria attramentaria TaxID=370345 RepID=A0ABD0KQD2_9CAEN
MGRADTFHLQMVTGRCLAPLHETGRREHAECPHPASLSLSPVGSLERGFDGLGWVPNSHEAKTIYSTKLNSSRSLQIGRQFIIARNPCFFYPRLTFPERSFSRHCNTLCHDKTRS